MKSLFDVVSETAVEYGISIKSRNDAFERVAVCSSSQSADYLMPLFGDDVEIMESFVILLLNRANKVTGWAKISSGGRAATVVDCALVAKLALDSLACGVILAHNHPSGNTVPSVQDDSLTRKIKDALALFDIRVLDHIIVTPSSGFYSYSDECRL